MVQASHFFHATLYHGYCRMKPHQTSIRRIGRYVAEINQPHAHLSRKACMHAYNYTLITVSHTWQEEAEIDGTGAGVIETDEEEVGSPTLEGVMDDTPDTEHFWEVDTVIDVDAEEEVECVEDRCWHRSCLFLCWDKLHLTCIT